MRSPKSAANMASARSPFKTSLRGLQPERMPIGGPHNLFSWCLAGNPAGVCNLLSEESKTGGIVIGDRTFYQHLSRGARMANGNCRQTENIIAVDIHPHDDRAAVLGMNGLVG